VLIALHPSFAVDPPMCKPDRMPVMLKALARSARVGDAIRKLREEDARRM